MHKSNVADEQVSKTEDSPIEKINQLERKTLISFRFNQKRMKSKYEDEFGEYPDIESLPIEMLREHYKRLLWINIQQEKTLPQNQTVEEWLADYGS